MNATPIQHGPDDREELARLLPGPAERDLPSDRHRRLQEFVMTQIEQDRRDRREARRSPRRRRPVLLAAALTAVAGTAAAVIVGTGGSPEPSRRSSPAAAAPSGQQILLVAATTAERTPEGTGKFWHVKVVQAGGRDLPETWTRRDGRTWRRGLKTKGKVVEDARPAPFRLGGEQVDFTRLQKLPTEAAALRGWLAKTVKAGDVTTSAGRPNAAVREQIVLDGLVSLVSQLPAPPKVRAAAFRAIAKSPAVQSLGPVAGGQGLLIKTGGDPVRLVVDPATARVRNTNHFVTADGVRISSKDGVTITAEWTNTLPR